MTLTLPLEPLFTLQIRHLFILYQMERDCSSKTGPFGSRGQQIGEFVDWLQTRTKEIKPEQIPA